ncbi:hypothetical protein [Caballeronia glathei]|jgi:hypothetical protein|nr:MULTISPECIES: hypothetical protein [Burkholderiaceae]
MQQSYADGTVAEHSHQRACNAAALIFEIVVEHDVAALDRIRDAQDP